MGILVKKLNQSYMVTKKPKIKTWVGIAGIAVFVFAWIAWAISEYRPTAKGQITWEWISGICFGIFVAMIAYAFIRYNKK